MSFFIAHGSPIDGMAFIGPFVDANTGVDYAISHFDCVWWEVAEMDEPDNFGEVLPAPLPRDADEEALYQHRGLAYNYQKGSSRNGWCQAPTFSGIVVDPRINHEGSIK